MKVANPKINFCPCDKPIINVADNTSVVSQLSRQTEWSFRIYAQMTYRQDNGYNNYFFTLTYKDKFLPKFTYRGVECPCFSRAHVKKFTRGIQMDLLKKYKVTDYDYILCCEFGKSKTFRPHLHGAISVPNTVNAQEVHDLIKKHWSVLTGKYTKTGLPLRECLGWVLPDKYYGGMDKKGHYHKPLLISPQNLDNASIYVSKYCTKQLGFFSNANVKKVSRLIGESKDQNAIREFRRVMPFIHTSLHFGEVIKDWIFGKNLPKSGLINVDSNPFENLANGIWTPLCRKSKTRIPFYISRKLMFDRLEEVVEKYTVYSESDWTDFEPDDDLFSHPTATTLKNCLRYKWITKYSDFWVDYNRWLLPIRIQQKKDDIDNFLIMLDQKHLLDYISSIGVSKRMLLDAFKNCNSASLALYDVVYRNRFSPAHYYAFWKNPDLFKNSYYTVTRHVKNKPMSDGYRKACGFDGFQIDEYDDQEFFDTYNHIRTTYIDIDFELETMMQEDNISAPYFTGHESIDYMKEKSEDFFMSTFSYVQSFDDTRLPYQFNCLFNSFPCFQGFDLMLNLIADYKNFCAENKIKKVQAEFEEKKSKKDSLFND